MKYKGTLFGVVSLGVTLGVGSIIYECSFNPFSKEKPEPRIFIDGEQTPEIKIKERPYVRDKNVFASLSLDKPELGERVYGDVVYVPSYQGCFRISDIEGNKNGFVGWVKERRGGVPDFTPDLEDLIDRVPWDPYCMYIYKNIADKIEI